MLRLSHYSQILLFAILVLADDDNSTSNTQNDAQTSSQSPPSHATLQTSANAQNTTAGSSSSQQQHSHDPTPADFYNLNLIWAAVYIWLVVFGLFFIHRLTLVILRYFRRLACRDTDKQLIFAQDGSSNYTAFKKHIIDAPLFRMRRRRELQPWSFSNFGDLPSRLQFIILTSYFILNMAFCFVNLNYSSPTYLTELRNRSGMICFMNMMPLFLFAGRNNVLIKFLGIPYNSFNLIHRWLGRICVLQALIHTFAFCINLVKFKGVAGLFESIKGSRVLMTGTIGIAAFIVLLLQSPSIARHAYYEFFLHVHRILALLALVVLWLHVDAVPPAKYMLIAVSVIWSFDWLMRLLRIVRNNLGAGGTSAEVQALPGDALRVTIRLARPWKFQAGQYIFLYIPSIGYWMNHPFSLAWSDEQDDEYSEKGMDRYDVLAAKKTTFSLLVRRRTGFTDKLWTKAENSPGGRFVTGALVEGPYGHQDLSSYGTVVLVAAGIGISHQVPFIRSLIADHANATGATRKITLIWIIRTVEHLEWIRPWMTEVLGMEKRREVLKIQLFVTQPRSVRDINSASSTVQMFPGKPDMGALIRQQQQSQIGAMAVSVCGTGSLSDDVRRVVRELNGKTKIDLYDSVFSW